MARVLNLPLPTPLVDGIHCFPWDLDTASEAQRAEKPELTVKGKPISTSSVVVLSVRFSSVLLYLPLVLILAHSYPVV